MRSRKQALPVLRAWPAQSQDGGRLEPGGRVSDSMPLRPLLHFCDTQRADRQLTIYLPDPTAQQPPASFTAAAMKPGNVYGLAAEQAAELSANGACPGGVKCELGGDCDAAQRRVWRLLLQGSRRGAPCPAVSTTDAAGELHMHSVPWPTGCSPPPPADCWSLNWNVFQEPASLPIYPESFVPENRTYSIALQQGEVLDVVFVNPSPMVGPAQLAGDVQLKPALWHSAGA